MRRDYGLWSRFLINRDSTFLHLLTAAQAEGEPASAPATCCNPLGAPHPLIGSGAAAAYAGAVTVGGLRMKLEDARQDARSSGKRWLAGALGAAAECSAGRAARVLAGFEFPTAAVRAALAEQPRIERALAAAPAREALYAAAEPTAFAFGEIYAGSAAVAAAPGNAAPLRAFGRAIGRLTYWMDAWQDRARDLRRGSFNPLLTAAGEPAEALADPVQSEVSAATAAFAQLSLRRSGSLADSLAGSGLPARARHVFSLGDQVREDETKQREEQRKKRKKGENDCCDCPDSSRYRLCDCCHCSDITCCADFKDCSCCCCEN